MWIPGGFALFYLKKEQSKIRWFEKPSKSWLLALALPILILALGMMVCFVFYPPSMVNFSLENNIFSSLSTSYVLNVSAFFLFLIGTGAISAMTVNYFFSVGEELLWRGYLWEKLKFLGFWKASYSIGLLWGLWHVPVILLLGQNYGKNGLLGSVLFTVICMLMTPILLYIRHRSKSLLPVSIFHGMFNALAGIPALFYKEPNLLVVSGAGIFTVIALIVVNLFMLNIYKKSFSSINNGCYENKVV